MDSTASLKFLNKKIVFQRAQPISLRFKSPELGDYIDLQMDSAVILNQITLDRDKISNKNNYFSEEPQTLSSRKKSALTDSSNNSKKLTINQGTDLHLILNYRVRPDRSTDEIHNNTLSAYPDELLSLSYFANLSGVEDSATLNRPR